MVTKAEIDLPEKTIAQMISVFSTYPEIETVIIFGSRALGNAKPGSDIDCAISGPQVTPQLVSKIQNFLEEETLIPYFFDCVCLESVHNKKLLNHIKNFGKVLYRRQA